MPNPYVCPEVISIPRVTSFTTPKLNRIENLQLRVRLQLQPALNFVQVAEILYHGVTLDDRGEPLLRFIKIHEVLARTGLSRSHLYALAQRGEFPKPVKLTERSSAWVELEVQEWIEARIAARDLEVLDERRR